MHSRAGLAWLSPSVATIVNREIFHGTDYATLAEAGVRPQTLLWASTGSKNPAYSDVLYVESLIGPETISTLPDATLAAFRRPRPRGQATLMTGIDEGASAYRKTCGAGHRPQ